MSVFTLFSSIILQYGNHFKKKKKVLWEKIFFGIYNEEIAQKNEKD